MTFAEKVASLGSAVVRSHIMAASDFQVYPADIACYVNNTEVNWVTPVLDTTTWAGNPSIKFTQASQSSSAAAGQWYMSWSPFFGAGETFYVQWQERRSRYHFEHHYNNSAGFKHAIIGTGGGTSCSSLELVVQNIEQRKVPCMYNSCDGGDAGAGYSFRGFDYMLGGGDVDFQPRLTLPPPAGQYCSWYETRDNQNFANCFTYASGLANPSDAVTRWCTKTMQVSLGSISGPFFANSNIKLWGYWEGDGAEYKIIDRTIDLVTAGTQKYGRIWLLPYQSQKDSTEVTDVAYVWVRDVIVATSMPPPTTTASDSPQLAVFLR